MGKVKTLSREPNAFRRFSAVMKKEDPTFKPHLVADILRNVLVVSKNPINQDHRDLMRSMHSGGFLTVQDNVPMQQVGSYASYRISSVHSADAVNYLRLLKRKTPTAVILVKK